MLDKAFHQNVPLAALQSDIDNHCDNHFDCFI